MKCNGMCCSRCNEMNRSQKFSRLLERLEKCSESMMYHDEIAGAVQWIRQVSWLD
jgi:hypothetical protein